MLNWARAHGRAVRAGEIVSTGTCTGHLFAAPGDTVRADFGPLGVVEAHLPEPVLPDAVDGLYPGVDVGTSATVHVALVRIKPPSATCAGTRKYRSPIPTELP